MREWTVPADHPALAGHFPGRPIVPGVVLLDRTVLLAAQRSESGRWAVTQAKFLRPALPGQTLIWTWSEAGADAMNWELRCGAHRVAVGQLRRERA